LQEKAGGVMPAGLFSWLKLKAWSQGAMAQAAVLM
jgi:hypothetical protein